MNRWSEICIRFTTMSSKTHQSKTWSWSLVHVIDGMLEMSWFANVQVNNCYRESPGKVNDRKMTDAVESCSYHFPYWRTRTPEEHNRRAPNVKHNGLFEYNRGTTRSTPTDKYHRSALPWSHCTVLLCFFFHFWLSTIFSHANRVQHQRCPSSKFLAYSYIKQIFQFF